MKGYGHVCLPRLLLMQVLMLYDSLDLMDKESAVKFVSSLQQSDGSFTGDKWGELQDKKLSYLRREEQNRSYTYV